MKDQRDEGGRRAQPTHLFDLLITHVLLTRDILPHNLIVHISFDTTGSYGIDGDFLVTEVYVGNKTLSASTCMANQPGKDNNKENNDRRMTYRQRDT